MRISVFLVLSFVSLLSGCGFMQKNTSIDGLESLRPPRDEDLVVRYKAVDVDDDGRVKVDQDGSPIISDRVFLTLYSEFINAQAEAYVARNDSDKILSYLDAGIALSNKACSEWFAVHNSESERVDHNQGLANLVGNAVVAGMGIAESSVNAMGYVGLILGGLNQGYEVFKEDFLLTGTIWKLEKGVREGRVAAAANLRANASGENPYTYFEAKDELLSYHNTCSRLQLIAYVEQSIELARYAPPEGTVNPAEQARLFQIGRDLYRAAKDEEGVFSEKRIKELYAIFNAPDTEQAIALQELPYLKDVKDRVDELSASEEPNEKARAIRFYDLLDQAGDLLNLDHEIQEKEEQIEAIDEEIEERENELEEESEEADPGADEEGQEEPGEEIAEEGEAEDIDDEEGIEDPEAAEEENFQDIVVTGGTRTITDPELLDLLRRRGRLMQGTVDGPSESSRRPVTLETMPRE